MKRPQSIVSQLLKDETYSIVDSIEACPACGRRKFFPMRIENTPLVMLVCDCGHAQETKNAPGPAKEYWRNPYWTERFMGMNECDR